MIAYDKFNFPKPPDPYDDFATQCEENHDEIIAQKVEEGYYETRQEAEMHWVDIVKSLWSDHCEPHNYDPRDSRI